MYAKIFSQIHDSSLSEDYLTRLVFMDLLLLCDEDGVVDITVEAVARRTNVPLDIVRPAIKKLEEPDPQSRSTNDGGRRIVRLDPGRDWGWRIVNYLQYRNTRTKEDRREYQRNYYRTNRSKEATKSQHDSTALNNSQHTQPSVYAYASASSSESASGLKNQVGPRRGFPIGGWSDPEDFTDWWDELIRKHPNRSKNAVAKSRAIEMILDGTLERSEFEAGYSAVAKANRDRWAEKRGQYAPNLFQFLDDRAWKFAPEPIAAHDPFHGLIEIK